MKKETGKIHVYYGDGKGKTTTGMGLILRAAGYGYRVMLYQFMKNNQTSERKILEKVENITLIDGLEQEKFSYQMTEEEKEERKIYYEKQFAYVTNKAIEEGYDVLFMDEIIYTMSAGLFEENLLLEFLKNKPLDMEVILTGNTPNKKLIELADYVSEIKKKKHPFDQGICARKGIED